MTNIKREIIVGMLAGIFVISISFLFFLVPSFKNLNLFYFLFGLGVIVLFIPFAISSVIQTRVNRQKNEMFLEFSRSLVESVSSGTPISKSIVNMASKNFGVLSPYIDKLANQIKLGIPIQKALETFAYDTNSQMIIRAISLIREADKTGGNIETILNSVAKSVAEIEKLKAERRAAISSIVMEGYIIFFIFIIIMIVVESQIIPITESMAGFGSFNNPLNPTFGNLLDNTINFSYAFLALLVTQGFFAGFIIGKISENEIKAGIKHSFILVAMAVLISTGSKLIL